jgi:malonyl-CoA O-methyltransferase
VNKPAVAASFGAAARSYDAAAVVQDEIRKRLLGRLDDLVLQPNSLLDLGGGTGVARKDLLQRYPTSRYINCDLSQEMLQYARKAHSADDLVCADAESLPFAKASFDLVFSASTFQWLNALERALLECARVLRPQGLLLFSTFGPDTLKELRSSFAAVDPYPRVNPFLDRQQVNDLLLKNRLSCPHVESEVIRINYANPQQLLRSLKDTGATNQLGGRSRGLLTPRRLQAAVSEYEAYKTEDGQYYASYEVIYGFAWRGDAEQ